MSDWAENMCRLWFVVYLFTYITCASLCTGVGIVVMRVEVSSCGSIVSLSVVVIGYAIYIHTVESPLLCNLPMIKWEEGLENDV